jgi:hypothetical protein
LGDPAADQYMPKTFTLTAGTHQLVVRAREGGTQVQSWTFVPTTTAMDAGLDTGATDAAADAAADTAPDAAADTATGADTGVGADASPLGATYYVNSSTGNDSNSGAQSAPFRTIQRAANVVVAGDTVAIAPGTYAESVSISRSGSSAAPIAFTAPNGVVIGGNVAVTGSYIVLNGPTVSPPSAGGYYAIVLTGQHDVLENCTVTNYGAMAADQSTAIGLSGAFNVVQGCTVANLNDIDVFHVFGHDQIIRGNRAANIQQVNYSLNHTDWIQTWGLNGLQSFNVLVEDNTVVDSSGQLGNIEMDGSSAVHDWTFQNNVFANVSCSLFSGVPNTRYYNNVFDNVGRAQGYAISLYTQTNYSSVGDEIINNAFLNNNEDVNFHSASHSDVVAFSNNYFAGANYAAKTNGEYQGIVFVNGGNPGLSNEAHYDFHLLTGSPLVRAGVNLSTHFALDKDGNPRPATGPWDIGPYQHVGL